ncbi:UDP-glucose/GDP-mannose dehydrogenase family protein [Thiomicrorhabdus sp. 6S2-11]|uniref:UDP-glucose 6-dehydrogenase n=1 Tax=Thiomicrorhabdus marina TaxID=2818442 RepID=A0ABS3Q3H4_9GAMM|nr:nucleotide sugar dehydrogenase [Thiomicrorhabdus marina]MBO1926380.1 UDP-glucose/GDP-mannose dehydrogenase family protein [Thiomicrorhabdus marina]
MIINVFGSTISALVTAGCLAETGNDVKLIGQLPNEIAEPGLQKLLEKQLQQKHLQITDQHAKEADFHIFAYGDGDCSVALDMAKHLAQENSANSTLLIRSNFGIDIAREIMQAAQMAIIINPDFAPEGSAIQGFQRPDRIIIGATDDTAIAKFRRLFAPFNRNRDTIIQMKPESAILTKYATNVLIATRISLMNELALVSEQMNADIEEVRQGLGSDHRIGFAYLYSGVGFGGAYLERDLHRVQDLIDQTGSQENLLRSVNNINEQQKELLFRKLWSHYECDLQNRQISIWGISYKPNTNSIEGAPSLVMIQALLHQGCELHLFDPKLDDNFYQWMNRHLSKAQQEKIHIYDNMYASLEASDALCVLTEWKNFWTPNFNKIKTLMSQPVILDGRNLYDKNFLKEQGFTYFGVGR